MAYQAEMVIKATSHDAIQSIAFLKSKGWLVDTDLMNQRIEALDTRITGLERQMNEGFERLEQLIINIHPGQPAQPAAALRGGRGRE